MQRWAKRSQAAFLFLAFLQLAAAQQATGTVRFRFAFGALTGSGENQKLTRIAEDMQLRTGDKIKLMVEMQQPGFFYVIHRGPAEEIDLLFPADLKQNLQVMRKYYVPDGAPWVEFDRNTGNETFYVLASEQRLGTLESLLQRYLSSPAAGKAGAASDIVAEIRRLRTQNRNATAPAERPVMIGGNVRSLDRTPSAPLPDVSTLAVEITAKDFYARTFTIDHR